MGIKSLRAASIAGAVAGLAVAVLPAVAVATPAAGLDHVIGHNAKTNVQESGNWSGYVETGSGYTSASASWTVPSASGNGYSSAWVGIDGDGNSDLIQTGTESDANGQYYAWWEILPAAETPIDSISVSPGDSMTASVAKESGSTWKIDITDNSNGESFSTEQRYSGPGESVEYIQEAVEVNGSISPMPKYSTFSFSGLTVNGGSPNLTSDDAMNCVQNGTTVSTAGAPNSSGNGFSVSYTG
jgi:Peptidase A4 family